MSAAQNEFGCRYSLAWVGLCGQLKGESGFCSQHTGVKCVSCSDQASHECSHTGQFVCGAPLCPDCEGKTNEAKPGGSWGFMNHSHGPKRAAKPEVPREMLAEDIGLSPSPAKATTGEA